MKKALIVLLLILTATTSGANKSTEQDTPTGIIPPINPPGGVAIEPITPPGGVAIEPITPEYLFAAYVAVWNKLLLAKEFGDDGATLKAESAINDARSILENIFSLKKTMGYFGYEYVENSKNNIIEISTNSNCFFFRGNRNDSIIYLCMDFNKVHGVLLNSGLINDIKNKDGFLRYKIFGVIIPVIFYKPTVDNIELRKQVSSREVVYVFEEMPKNDVFLTMGGHYIRDPYILKEKMNTIKKFYGTIRFTVNTYKIKYLSFSNLRDVFVGEIISLRPTP